MTAINANNGFHLCPQDVRHIIYSHVDSKGLLNLVPVCQLFNTELSNELFEKICKNHPTLNLIQPCFYDPLIKGANSPWKVAFFCLSEPREDRLGHISKKLASASLEKFKNYLLNTTIPCFQEETNRYKKEFESINGRYFKDPNSQIHKAWEDCQENWTQKDELELEELVKKTDPSHVFAKNKSFEEPLNKSFFVNKSFFEEEMKSLDEQTANFDRKQVLWEKKIIAHRKYNRVALSRDITQRNIDSLNSAINNYKKITNNTNHLEQYSSSIFHTIIKGLITQKKWGAASSATFESLKQTVAYGRTYFNYNELTPEKTKVARELIHSLPEEASSFIWQQLYNQCANNAQEWQWSEKHFHQHATELGNCIEKYISLVQQHLPTKTNPTTDQNTLKLVLKDQFEEATTYLEMMFGSR